MFLTRHGGAIIGPIAAILGEIMNFVYNQLEKVGIMNLGICIIVFTIIVRLLIFPLSFKQTKSSKIMNYIQPEIAKATKKYKGKKDQESIIAMQKASKEIQSKYGVSMTGGCLTSIIQLPIFLAFFRVVQNMPAYIGRVYNLYDPIAKEIGNNGEDSINKLIEFKNQYSSAKIIKVDPDNYNTIIDVLAKLPSEAWIKLQELYGNGSSISNIIEVNSEKIIQLNQFVPGIDISVNPALALTLPILVPIASMIFQFMSMKVSQTNTPTDPTQESTAGMMKIMMKIMPVFSFVICLQVPIGMGIYWATGSLIAFATAVTINTYYKHADMEKIIEKSKEKANKKNEKKAASGKKSFFEKMQEAAYGEKPEESKPKNISSVANSNYKGYSTSNNSNYKKGSIASKANIMQDIKDKGSGGK